jgi:hypothetical protein
MASPLSVSPCDGGMMNGRHDWSSLTSAPGAIADVTRAAFNPTFLTPRRHARHMIVAVQQDRTTGGITIAIEPPDLRRRSRSGEAVTRAGQRQTHAWAKTKRLRVLNHERCKQVLNTSPGPPSVCLQQKGNCDEGESSPIRAFAHHRHWRRRGSCGRWRHGKSDRLRASRCIAGASSGFRPGHAPGNSGGLCGGQ